MYEGLSKFWSNLIDVSMFISNKNSILFYLARHVVLPILCFNNFMKRYTNFFKNDLKSYTPFIVIRCVLISIGLLFHWADGSWLDL